MEKVIVLLPNFSTKQDLEILYVEIIQIFPEQSKEDILFVCNRWKDEEIIPENVVKAEILSMVLEGLQENHYNQFHIDVTNAAKHSVSMDEMFSIIQKVLDKTKNRTEIHRISIFKQIRDPDCSEKTIKKVLLEIQTP